MHTRSSGRADIEPAADISTRQRILEATAEVMGRNGMNKLSLSEVALEAGVSRPTLYRWFACKQDLLDAYVVWERSLYEHAIAKATAGLAPSDKLDAVLRVIAAGQQSYPGLRIVDVEPGLVIDRLSEALPPMRAGLERLMPGPGGAQAAATVVRVAISHYLVRSDDAEQFLAQLRHAARVKRPSRASATEASTVAG
jgi:TetR/AcrR family transcriptional regulator, repressor for uid operon